MVGTPSGGALYTRFGFRGPFIFGEICTVVDLILRCLVIERDVAIRYGYDPATGQDVGALASLEAPSVPQSLSDAPAPSSPLTPSHPVSPTLADPEQNSIALDSIAPSRTPTPLGTLPARTPLPMLKAIRSLAQSPRAMVALTMSFVYGYVAVSNRMVVLTDRAL